jgi:1-deoxy-D-xylulose 5-phosphate reductoisomerase
MKKSVEFMETHKLEAKMFLPKYTPIDEEVAKASDIHALYEINDTTINAIQQLADMLLEYKLLESRIDVRKMLLTDKDFQ